MAMTDRQVLWTALPAGIVGGIWHLSVYVSPRLAPPVNPASDSTLGAPLSATDPTHRFADFLDWASIPVTFHVQLSSGKTYPATISPLPTNTRKPDLWKALFPPKTPVDPYVFQDFSQWRIITPPVNALAGYLANTYKSVAKLGPDNLPTLAALTSLFVKDGSIIPVPSRPHNPSPSTGPLAQVLAYMRGNVGASNTPFATSSTALPLIAQLYAFLKPTFPARNAVVGDSAPVPPTLDFHQILSSLASYPQVLRWLGIAFDLTLDPSATADLIAGTNIRVLPTRPGGTGIDKSPWTMYTVQSPTQPSVGPPSHFTAAPSPGAPNGYDSTFDGLLTVDKPRYAVVPLDVSGATIKLCNFVEQLTAGTVDVKAQAGLPSLRSAGLSLVVSGRSDDLSHVFQTASHNNASVVADGDGGNVTLGAAELTRGFRVDVWDGASNNWASLCGRTYQLIGSSTDPVTDEGTLTASATSTPGTNELSMVESLFRWMGSGLCTPPPGAPSAQKTGALQIKLGTPATPMPQLFFGHGYRFRVRCVDLAGNSASPQDASLAGTTHVTPGGSYWTQKIVAGSIPSWSPVPGLTRYLRYEPVGAPTLRPILPAPFPPAPNAQLFGESVGVLVVRTAVSPSPLDGICSRRVDPPAVDASVAAQHAPQTKPPAPGSGGLTEQKNPPGIVISTIPPVVITSKPPLTLSSDGPPLKVTLFNQAVPTSETFNYIPDPLAVGAAFQVCADVTFSNLLTFTVPPVAGTNGGSFLLDLVPLAPGATPSATVELTSSALAKVFVPSGCPLLKISLPPASVLKLRVSSTLATSGVELMALWDVIKQATADTCANDPASTSRMLNDRLPMATQGRFPMLTPFREITLVHALEKPLAPALLNVACQTRTAGQTSAHLTGSLQSDRNSTAKVDLDALWKEWLDSGSGTPTQIDRTAHVLSMTIATVGPPADPIGDDTTPGHQEFGDTRYRQVTYQPTASTRFAEYFPPPSSPLNQQQHGAGLSIAIPSTARPLAPKVLYIVPTFRWVRTDSNGTVVSQRLGGGFRVFLDRPWHSSGDGELLAVVLPNANSQQQVPPTRGEPLQIEQQPVAALLPYVTSIGADPLSVPGGPSSDISSDNFLNATAYAKNVALLPEVPSASVDVAAYPVQWSVAHQSWFADIHVDPYLNHFNNQHYFGYMPFVRFALARYQPNSIPRCEVSPVVRMDPVQSVPDRTVQVMPVLSLLPGLAPTHSPVLFTMHVSGETMTRPDGGITIAFDISLEGTVSNAATAQSETDWIPIPTALTQNADPGPFLAAAQITLPSARGTRGFRVVIIEKETYASDAGPASRIVYVDAVLL